MLITLDVHLWHLIVNIYDNSPLKSTRKCLYHLFCSVWRYENKRSFWYGLIAFILADIHVWDDAHSTKSLLKMAAPIWKPFSEILVFSYVYIADYFSEMSVTMITWQYYEQNIWDEHSHILCIKSGTPVSVWF